MLEVCVLHRVGQQGIVELGRKDAGRRAERRVRHLIAVAEQTQLAAAVVIQQRLWLVSVQNIRLKLEEVFTG